MRHERPTTTTTTNVQLIEMFSSKPCFSDNLSSKLKKATEEQRDEMCHWTDTNKVEQSWAEDMQMGKQES